MSTPLIELSKIHAKGRPGLNPYLDRLTDHPNLLLAENANAWKGRWSERFGREVPFWVELGSGSGNWLIKRATQNPQANHLGLEIRFKRLVRSAEKTAQAGLANLQFARYSVTLLEELFTPESVVGFVIQFPEPWNKPRQRKHRIFTPEYFGRIGDLLIPGGKLIVKSDHIDYFQFMRQGIDERGFEIAVEEHDLLHSSLAETNTETEFEQMFRSKKIPIRYLEARKAS